MDDCRWMAGRWRPAIQTGVLAAVGRVVGLGRVALNYDPFAHPRHHSGHPLGAEVLPQPPLACGDALLATSRVPVGVRQPAARARLAVLDPIVAVELGFLGLGEYAVGIDPWRCLDLIPAVGRGDLLAVAG